MTEENINYIPDYKNALFIKDDGTEIKFNQIKYKNKNGDIKTYIYEYKYDKESQHNRSKKFYEIHKDEITKQIFCDICKKSISNANFKKHLTTNKHLRNIEIHKIMNSPVKEEFI